MVCPRCARSGASVWIINSNPARLLWGCQCGQAWSADSGNMVEDIAGPRP